MFGLNKEQEQNLRFEVQQLIKECISSIDRELAIDAAIDLLENEVRNVMVGIWFRYHVDAEEPDIGVKVSVGRSGFDIFPKNETAAYMMWGINAFRDGASKK